MTVVPVTLTFILTRTLRPVKTISSVKRIIMVAPVHFSNFSNFSNFRSAFDEASFEICRYHEDPGGQVRGRSPPLGGGPLGAVPLAPHRPLRWKANLEVAGDLKNYS